MQIETEGLHMHFLSLILFLCSDKKYVRSIYLWIGRPVWREMIDVSTDTRYRAAGLCVRLR